MIIKIHIWKSESLYKVQMFKVSALWSWFNSSQTKAIFQGTLAFILRDVGVLCVCFIQKSVDQGEGSQDSNRLNASYKIMIKIFNSIYRFDFWLLLLNSLTHQVCFDLHSAVSGCSTAYWYCNHATQLCIIDFVDNISQFPEWLLYTNDKSFFWVQSFFKLLSNAQGLFPV